MCPVFCFLERTYIKQTRQTTHCLVRIVHRPLEIVPSSTQVDDLYDFTKEFIERGYHAELLGERKKLIWFGRLDEPPILPLESWDSKKADRIYIYIYYKKHGKNFDSKQHIRNCCEETFSLLREHLRIHHLCQQLVSRFGLRMWMFSEVL